MLRKLVLYALVLYVAMPSLAQMELKIEPIPLGLRQVFDEKSDATDTTADYLFLTQKSNYCVTENLYDGPSRSVKWLASVCVFENPIERGYILYTVSDPWSVAEFVILYDGQVVRAAGTGFADTMPNIRPGNYEVLIVLNGDPLHSVTFRIPNPDEDSSDD